MSLLLDIDKKRVTLKDALKFDLWDMLITIINIIPSVVIWISLKKTGNISKIHISSNAIGSYAMAKHKLVNLETGKICKLETPFPLHSILLQFFWLTCFKNETLGSMVLCILMNALSGLLLRRYIQTLKFVNDFAPIILPCVLPFFPMSSIIQRSVDSSYSLLFCEILLMLLTKTWNTPILMFTSFFLAVWTSYYGILAAISFSLMTITKKKRRRGRDLLLLTFTSFFGLLLYHFVTRGKLTIMFQNMNINKLYPFRDLFKNSLLIAQLRSFHSWYLYIIPPLFASIAIFQNERSLGLFGILSILFSTIVTSYDKMSEASLIQAVSILIGFEPLITHKDFRPVLYIFGPFLAIFSIYTAFYQIRYDVRNINVLNTKC